MRFRDKIEEVLPLQPDLMIIPECEAPEKWNNQPRLQSLNQFLWYGENKNKGLGIISLNQNLRLQLHSLYNDAFRFIVPITVTGEEEFILFAIWAQNAPKKFDSYIGQIYMALQYYKELLREPCILAGDWNSNKVFDYIRRVGTHTDVVTYLKNFNIHSTYHYFYKEEHGLETTPTYFFRKESEKPFHLDYIFASTDFLQRIKRMDIGSSQDWISISDHFPLTLEIE